MTTECTGGTSAPKAGYAEFVAVSSGALALALQRYGGARLQWLIPLLGLAPLELGPFCGSSPPALPTFTEDEVFSLLRLGLDADYFSGLGKARDLVTRMLWFDFCQCTSGTLIDFVEPDLPDNTPQPVGPVSTNVPCKPYTPSATYGITGALNYHCAGSTTLPAGATYIRARATGTIYSGAGSGADLSIEVSYPVGAATVLPGGVVRLPASGTTTWTWGPIPPNAGVMCGVLSGIGAAGGTDFALYYEIFCGGLPGTTPQPCCPPDEATQSYLDLILNMVTLIQRQAAPFSYVYGANHTALSGHGSFAVSGLLGVSIDVTTLPSSRGREDGSPETLFDLGYVTLGTADGYDVSRRIDHDGSLVLPPHAGVFTSVGYTLTAGVEVAIRELVREP